MREYGPQGIDPKIVINRLKRMAVRDVLIPTSDRVVAKPEFPQHFDESFCDHVADGYWPVMIANHQHWFDLIAIGRVVSHLRTLMNKSLPSKVFRGFRLAVAASITSGHQGEDLQYLYEAAENKARSYGIEPVEVAREKDRSLFGFRRLRKAVRVLLHSKPDGYGIASFPEGSVDGGRSRIPNGDPEDIIGMIQPQPDDIALGLINASRKNGDRFVIIPVGLHGSYRTMDLHIRSIRSIRTKVIRSWLLNAPLVSEVVGMPITTDEVHASSEDVPTFVMQQIATLVPPQAQGIYKTSSR